MGRAVLMIAFHFPPAAMGSGHLRTIGFARHLPGFGWDPVVLSATPRAYPSVAPASADAIREEIVVARALAFDARRHFGIGGKYPAFLAQPDRWNSWWPAAVLQGLRLIRRHRVRAIWSTYPIMTAHCIARTLSAMTRLPWIADFRDPVSSSVEAGNPYTLASQQRWERRVMRDATCAVFTTPGAVRDYSERFPEVSDKGRVALIANGYDEDGFADLPVMPPPRNGRPLVMLHSGLLYPEGRNPVPFLTALARLKAAGVVGAGSIEIVLRASGSEGSYAREIERLGLEKMVTLAPHVSNREALEEQASADALLLFQGGRYDRQIPAKVYEYLRIGRPIFAMLGQSGDTANLLRETGGAELVSIEDVSAIEERLRVFIEALRTDRAPQAKPGSIAKCSRREGAALLAGLLDEVAK
ncbi:MAG TPA: glycosyltransferase [Rhodanobacteraceae bacterium]|nr:glycosyltransferase [Rhodanobacteraceae bacterium]